MHSRPKAVDQYDAIWYSNVTTWQMVLDLNLIAIYGTRDGKLSELPQRMLFSMCDGIIGGQGNGPLFPDPLPLGFLSFTNNAEVYDYIFALRMKIELGRIPLIENTVSIYERDLSNINLNSMHISEESLNYLSIHVLPPPGWKEYLQAGERPILQDN